jgi:hypothetical protein
LISTLDTDNSGPGRAFELLTANVRSWNPKPTISGSIQKRISFAPFYTKNVSFYQDRLGTSIEKTQKETRFSQVRRQMRSSRGEKTALFEAFIYKMHDFAKTARLGTNIGKALKKSAVFVQAPRD